MDSVGIFKVFVHVAETRSFVAAGRQLGVSASAVGKSIVRLETRLGVRLFHRSTRSVTLTAEGGLFLERCRRILVEIEAAQAELTHTTMAPRGRLRVSLPLVGDPFLSVLARFKLAFPDVDLDLDFSDRRVDVIDEGFDAVLRSGEAFDSRLSARLLGSYRMLIVAAPSYLLAHGTPLHPHELSEHTCIRFRYPNTGKLEVWPLQRDARDSDATQSEADESDAPLPLSMVCNNLEARVCFARHGVGLAYLPDFAIRDWLADGTLVTVLDDHSAAGGSFRIMWPSGNHLTPKLRVFIDFLKEHLFPESPGREE